MIEIFIQWFSSKFNHNKAEKNGWTAIIGIVSGIGTYAITGQTMPSFFQS
tara:strand:+ start:258 stop:407 length:150 start_codon:yes stop_codon:yes gene_type:complete